MNRLLTLIMAGLVVAVPLSTTAQSDDDWGSTETSDRRQEIIRRYQDLLERRPVEGTVFERLLQEVGSGRGLTRLIESYEAGAVESPGRVAYPIILGHLYKRAGRLDEAIEAYERALEIEPGHPTAAQSLADALARAGRRSEAREAYERALEWVSDDRDREDILFDLADLAFDDRDFEAAAAYLDRVVVLSPRDVYVREQLAQVLAEHGQYDQAIAQYEAILDLAGRDTRQRAMTKGAIGDLLVELGRTDEALDRYRDAQGDVSRGSWLWSDLERRIIDAARAGGDLAALTAEYEERWPRPSFEQMRILVELYEELGRDDDALEMARRAVRADRRSIDARLDLVRILERRGEIDEVIQQYEWLIDHSDEPLHGLRLAELHRQRGDEASALATLERLERLYQRRPTVLARLAERYVRWGYRDRARAIYERLVEEAPDDPEQLVTLGALHFMEGRREAALEVWARIPEAAPDAVTAQLTLGRVYADHGLVDRAVAAFEQALALEPDNPATLRALAELYEQVSRYGRALALWQQLADAADADDLRAEARERILSIWSRQGVLRERAAALSAEFEAEPERADLGYLLGQAYLALGELDQAELTFLDLLEGNPDDVQALTALAQLYQAQYRLTEAITLLEQLAELDTDQAWRYTEAIVDVSLRLFDDERAVAYATRTVELNPNDPRAYARLARVYQRTQRLERALAAYEEALRLDRRAFEVAFELADLAVTLGRPAVAVEHLRAIVRESRDEGEVLRAGRLLIQLRSEPDELLALLSDWQSLLNRPGLEWASRRLAVDALTRFVRPWRRVLLDLDLAERRRALSALSDVTRAAARALPSAVRDPNRALRLDTLTLMGLLGLGSPTVVEVLGDSDSTVRATAVLVLGLSGDIDALDPLAAALADEASEVRQAAAWALGVLGGEGAAEPLMGTLRRDRSGPVRAQAAIALGRLGTPSGAEHVMVAAGDGDSLVRQAALWALGAMGVAEGRQSLLVALRDGEVREQRAAAWSLGALTATDEVVGALLEACWTAQPEVARTAAEALARLSRPGDEASVVTLGLVAEPHLGLALDDLLDALTSVSLRGDLPPDEVLLWTYRETLSEVLAAILGGPNRDARVRVLTDLAGVSETLGLGRWLAGATDGGRSAEVSERVGGALAPILIARLEAPAGRERALAAAVLGRLDDVGESGFGALQARLLDPHAEVRRQAALALGRLGVVDSAGGLIRLLADQDCSVRAAAAASVAWLDDESGLRALAAVAEEPACQLVPVGMMWGAAQSPEAATAEQLLELASGRAERVRAAIAATLLELHTPTSRQLVDQLRSDPSPAVRRAASPRD